MSNLVGQREFIAKIKANADSTYGTDSAFSVVCLGPMVAEGVKYNSTEIVGLLSGAISRAMVKPGDFYSFFDGKFYISTAVENQAIITDFLNSLALRMLSIYDNKLCLVAAIVQHPYDVMDFEDIFTSLAQNMFKVTPQRKVIVQEQLREQDSNYFLGLELTQFLQQINAYSERLYKHSLLVAKLSLELAKAFDFSGQSVKKIVVAAILHDIGYLLVPKELFLGPRQLKAKNAATIRLHPLLATRKLLQDKPVFRNVFDLIEQHHENSDSSGYPFGLSRSDLNIESQIISLSDNYALLAENPNITPHNIVEFFVARSGFLWDEVLVDELLSVLKKGILDKEVSLQDLFNFA